MVVFMDQRACGKSSANVDSNTVTVANFIEDIEAVIGEIKVEVTSNSNPQSPGQLDKHYATTKSLKLFFIAF